MRALGGIFLGAMLATSAASQPPSIEVFTTARYPIATASTPAVLVYNLDLPALIEAELSTRLPRDSEIAAQLASAELQGAAWRKSAETLTHAYQGLLKARQYSLETLPAVVFDGQAVIYGITDLSQALSHYRRWQVGGR
jgi:integrating conjugative element protein (TIGR03757 family)